MKVIFKDKNGRSVCLDPSDIMSAFASPTESKCLVVHLRGGASHFFDMNKEVDVEEIVEKIHTNDNSKIEEKK